MDNQILAHTKYNCTYHIVFIPKYRRKVMYGKIGKEIGEILSMVCKITGIELIKGEVCPNRQNRKRGCLDTAYRRYRKMPQRGSPKPPAEPVVKPYGCDSEIWGWQVENKKAGISLVASDIF